MYSHATLATLVVVAVAAPSFAAPTYSPVSKREVLDHFTRELAVLQ